MSLGPLLPMFLYSDIPVVMAIGGNESLLSTSVNALDEVQGISNSNKIRFFIVMDIMCTELSPDENTFVN